MEALIELNDRYLRQLSLKFERPLLQKIDWTERLIGLRGARGVGKTTLLLQYLKQKRTATALYVSLDDVALPFQSIVELADWFTKRGGKILVLDEIHTYPKWSVELKNIYDRYPDLQIIFTGSSILQLSAGDADLSRRAVFYTMQGLTFREYIEIETGEKFSPYTFSEIIENHRDIANNICSRIKPLEYFGKYLQTGFYPFYLQNPKSYHTKLLNTIKLVIETDLGLVTHSTIEDVNNIKKLLYLLSKSVPFKPNINQIAASMQISRTKVYQFFDYLSQADIIYLLQNDSSGVKQFSKPEKIYLHHPNLIYAFDLNPSVGNVRETFFMNALAPSQSLYSATKADFVVNDLYTFEIGGKNKGFSQIKDTSNAYLVRDDIETGFDNKIPLWLWGWVG